MGLELEELFHGAVEAIRRNEGLTTERVRRAVEGRGSTAAQWKRIRSSEFGRRLAMVAEAPFEAAIVSYMGSVARRLPEQERCVVDMTLALRLDPGRSYAEDLTQRRRQARDAVAGLQPTRPSFLAIPDKDTKYREDIEKPSLQLFARLLDSPVAADFVEIGIDPEAMRSFLVDPAASSGAPGRVVVLGGAVMDLNFRLSAVPDIGESEQALNYKPFPGGKGLTQAVACARLGMATTLISVVGDDSDPYTLDILGFLEDEGVDSSLIEQVVGERAPVTAVVTTDRPRGSFAIGWKNEHNLPFGPRALHTPERTAVIEGCDYFLASFELPSSTVVEGLMMAKRAKATTIVTPAPPYADNLIDRSNYKYIDFMVANLWELESFARIEHRADVETGELQALALPLVSGRSPLRNLLVVHDRQCHAFTRPSTKGARAADPTFAVPTWPTTDRESAGDRDAFCAMLALKLCQLDGGQQLSLENAVHWATASMACAGGHISVPDSMPTLDEVIDLVDEGHVEIPD